MTSSFLKYEPSSKKMPVLGRGTQPLKSFVDARGVLEKSHAKRVLGLRVSRPRVRQELTPVATSWRHAIVYIRSRIYTRYRVDEKCRR